MKMQALLYKISIFALILIMLSSSVCSCGNKKEDSSDAVSLSFKSSASYDYLKSINGQKVTISGYMATSSPVDGSFIFLMNLPYQSCPFCVPNTSQLSNTMEIYPKKNESFSYTAQAIKVVGTLEVAESEDEPFTDMYGYEFSFKIVDATYTVIKAEDLSKDMALWQKIAESDIINDIYRMYDYVNFVCAWNTYYVNSYIDVDGSIVPGYYVWPSDAKEYIYTSGAQFNYGYKEGYFDSIIARIEAIDKTAFSELVANVRAAEALATKALAELDAGNYTCEYKYIEMFGTEDYVYTLNKGEELKAEMNQIYSSFSDWLGSYEM